MSKDKQEKGGKNAAKELKKALFLSEGARLQAHERKRAEKVR